jgi:hypothetical protein
MTTSSKMKRITEINYAITEHNENHHDGLFSSMKRPTMTTFIQDEKGLRNIGANDVDTFVLTSKSLMQRRSKVTAYKLLFVNQSECRDSHSGRLWLIRFW